MVAFLREALEKKNDEDNFIFNFREKALKDLNVLGNAREEVEKQIKLRNIKKVIQKGL